MEHKIVVHLKDGTVHKGVTQDFDPGAEAFHLLPAEGGGVPVAIRIEDMKAMFYVRDYLGNRNFNASRSHAGDPGDARKVILKFRDGEEIARHSGAMMAGDIEKWAEEQLAAVAA